MDRQFLEGLLIQMLSHIPSTIKTWFNDSLSEKKKQLLLYILKYDRKTPLYTDILIVSDC